MIFIQFVSVLAVIATTVNGFKLAPSLTNGAAAGVGVGSGGVAATNVGSGNQNSNTAVVCKQSFIKCGPNLCLSRTGEILETTKAVRLYKRVVQPLVTGLMSGYFAQKAAKWWNKIRNKKNQTETSVSSTNACHIPRCPPCPVRLMK